ncbi:hypothetical protein STENM223S_04744 [Streptomyces tendae]
MLLDALREGRERTVGLGLTSGTPGTEDEAVPSRWFTFNAGLGFDAGVVGRVEQQRERGRRSTHALYMRQVVRQLLGDPHRRRGVITLDLAGEEPVDGSGALHSVEHLAVDVPRQPPDLRLAAGVVRHGPRRIRSQPACRPPRLPGMARSCSLRPRSADPAAGTPCRGTI